MPDYKVLHQFHVSVKVMMEEAKIKHRKLHKSLLRTSTNRNCDQVQNDVKEFFGTPTNLQTTITSSDGLWAYLMPVRVSSRLLQ